MKSDPKKRKKAVAIKYDQSKDSAPKVTAKGDGTIAEHIIELAREAGIPIKENQDLVEILSRLDINQEIPPETYVVVAQILSWVYQINNRAKTESTS